MSKIYEAGYYAEITTYEGDADNYYTATVLLAQDVGSALSIITLLMRYFKALEGKYANSYVADGDAIVHAIADAARAFDYDYLDSLFHDAHIYSYDDNYTFRAICDVKTFHVPVRTEFLTW